MVRKKAKVARATVCDSWKARFEVGLPSSGASLSVVGVPAHVRTWRDGGWLDPRTPYQLRL